MAPSLDSDGKSEATVLLEMLLERMEEQYTAFSEALSIPLGVQEVTMQGFRAWWNGASYEMRMQAIREYGVDAVMRFLGPVVQGG